MNRLMVFLSAVLLASGMPLAVPDAGAQQPIVVKFNKSEVIVLTPAQKALWKKALVGVHKENESRVGKETLEAVYQQTGFKP